MFPLKSQSAYAGSLASHSEFLPEAFRSCVAPNFVRRDFFFFKKKSKFGVAELSGRAEKEANQMLRQAYFQPPGV